MAEFLEEISEDDFKEYAHINEKDLLDLEDAKFDISSLKVADEVIVVNIVFFENDWTKFKTILEQIELYMSNGEINIPLPKSEYESFNKIVAKIKETYEIKSLGIALVIMAELSKKQLEQEV